jgi:hypothetical protein
VSHQERDNFFIFTCLAEEELGTREVHAQGHPNVSVGRRNVTLPHVYAKPSKMLDANGRPAGKGLFTKKALPAGEVVTELGIP